MTGNALRFLAVWFGAFLLLVAGNALGQKPPSAGAPKGLFLIQPFDSTPMTITSLDVAAGGDIVLAAMLPDGPHIDGGLRVARFDAGGRRLWERNPAPKAEFVSTVIARAVGLDSTLVVLDETPKEQSQLALLRLDGKGQTAWRRELGPGAVSDLVVDGEAGAIVSGSVPREKSGEIEALVMRVTPDGLPVWRRRFSGERREAGNSADLSRLGPQSTPFVAGLADIAYDKDDSVLASRGIAMKLLPDGQPAWRQLFGDGTTLTMVGGLAPGPVGDAYVLAMTETAAAAGHFIELIRLRADGSVSWRRPLAGPASQEINDLVALPGGGLALAGSEPQTEETRAAVLILLDADGIERTRVNYRGYKMRRALMLKAHPAGGFAILFEGPAGSGFDSTNYLARVDAQGRF